MILPLSRREAQTGVNGSMGPTGESIPRYLGTMEHRLMSDV